ncbi:MAG: NUDIX domain-containing protein [Candidatus Saccharimonadales bacterium]
MTEILDIVNEQDEIVGYAEREKVHQEGLICRMILILFYTPDKKLILQRRSMSKLNSPGKLTTTVSGHVGQGMSYDQAAIKESLEESGVTIDVTRLSKLPIRYVNYIEDNHGKEYLSNVMRASYAYAYDGDPLDLKIEGGEGVGFEVVSIDEFKSMQINHPEDLAPYLLDQANSELVAYIEQTKYL